jgi:hypothetical protein
MNKVGRSKLTGSESQRVLLLIGILFRDALRLCFPEDIVIEVGLLLWRLIGSQRETKRSVANRFGEHECVPECLLNETKRYIADIVVILLYR